MEFKYFQIPKFPTNLVDMHTAYIIITNIFLKIKFHLSLWISKFCNVIPLTIKNIVYVGIIGKACVLYTPKHVVLYRVDFNNFVRP